MLDGAKTTEEHWNEAYRRQPRMRLPSPLNVSTRNLQSLLRREIRPGMRVLEVGFAPGKQLVWVAQVLQAEVSGLDYSEPGVNTARKLFETLGAQGDLRCGDIFGAHFPSGSFDLVYSAGLIEHFDDPTEIIRRHVLLARSGGVVLIVVPNYQGIYGRIQARFDRPNLGIHNLEIMTPEALAALVPKDLAWQHSASRVGRLDPWLISFGSKWPSPLARGAGWLGNALGLIQPFDIAPLCPWLVLRVVRQ